MARGSSSHGLLVVAFVITTWLLHVTTRYAVLLPVTTKLRFVTAPIFYGVPTLTRYDHVTTITSNYVTLRYVTVPDPGLLVTQQPWSVLCHVVAPV